MIHDGLHCHTCNCPVQDGGDFRRHANAGHVITAGVPEATR